MHERYACGSFGIPAHNAVAWQAVDDALGYVDGVTDSNDLVESRRLPAAWSGLTDPFTWTEQLTVEFYNHVRQGQLGYLSNDEIFQFFRVSNTERDTELRGVQHPESYLFYPPAGRLFLRRLLVANDNDQEARAECFDHLPWRPAPGQAYGVFPEAEFQSLISRFAEQDVFKKLVERTRDYELYGPVQVSSVCLKE